MTISSTLTSSTRQDFVPSTPIVSDENSNEISEIKTFIFEKYLQSFKAEIPTYKISCKNWGEIRFLNFFTGSSKLHDIKLLFTEFIIERSSMFFKRKMPIKCNDIINMVSESSILLLESETGEGKSAMIQYGLSDWSEGGHELKTAGYNFIFPMTFQNKHLCSVADLIRELIPKVRTHMTNEDIMMCIADPSLNILFMCDAYDQKHYKSNKLFQEICSLKEKHKHIKVIVTSRPESVQELKDTTCSNLDIDHFKVRGISDSMRHNFLKKYHDELVRVGLSQHSTADLLKYYESCSVHHKDLYLLQINLVILSWLWGQDPNIVKAIKSAAGLYTALLDILNEKLIKSIGKSHPDTMTKEDNDIRKLTHSIDCFMVKFYYASLVALKHDRIFIDKAEIKKLLNVCRVKELPHLEVLGTYLLANESEIELEESVQIPHNDLRDFYAAKYLESMLNYDNSLLNLCKAFFFIFLLLIVFVSEHLLQWCFPHLLNGLTLNEWFLSLNVHSILGLIFLGTAFSTIDVKKYHWANKGNRVKNIILELYGNNYSKFQSDKYQNLLIMLGELIGLKDPSLIKEHGKDIVDLLKETGICTNAQWYAVYSKFNINPKVAEHFANHISIHLDLNDFTIKDNDVEVLSSLLKYVNVDTVKFDISTTAIQSQLFILVDLLRKKQCNMKISNIEDEQVNLWNSIIKPNDKVEILKVTLKSEYTNLPLRPYHNTVNEYHLQSYWRDLCGATPMVQCNVRRLWTAVNTTDVLPISITHLYLGLLVDPITGATKDPGFAQLTQRCPQLEYLGVHVKVETVTENLPCLPDIGKYSSRTSLFLPHLSDYEHVQWAVDTAKKLQPKRGYFNLFLPRCGIWVSQLCELMKELASAGVTVNNVVAVSSGHSRQETEQLRFTTRKALQCDLIWYQNDDKLSCEWYW